MAADAMEAPIDTDALIYGVNQRSAGPLLRRRLLEVDGDPGRRLADLRAAGLTQAVLLDTCERLDVVAAGSKPEVLRERLPPLRAAWGQVEAEEVAAQAYLLEGEAAVRHLFAVASSLDSEILGEPQVLGQVKESHRAASTAGMTGPFIDRLFEAAYAAAKRVRSETGLAAQPVTIAAAALQVARRIHGTLDRSTALIAGLGQAEALQRAKAYVEAGADMILIHSKQKTPDEIDAFIAAWDGSAPLVLVPTAYPEMTVDRMRASDKVGMAIWGNHAVRAAVTAMQDIFSRILKDGGIHGVDKDIVPVTEVFRLQDMDRVKEIEQQFLR